MKKYSLYSALISFLSLVLTNPIFAAPSVVDVVQLNNEWILTVDGDPFFIRGISYNQMNIGEDPNLQNWRDWMIVDDNDNGLIDAPYEAFVDENQNGIQDPNEPSVGDFQLMREMGANAIRVYHHPSDAPEVQDGYNNNPGFLLQYNHPPNKDVLRDLFQTYGIRTVIGDFLGAFTLGSGADFADGTDYTDPIQRDRMKASVRQMVLDFRDEEFLLFYILGNENNYTFTVNNAGECDDNMSLNDCPGVIAYAQFLEELAQMIHQMDPNHPVAISIGDIGRTDAPGGGPWYLDVLATHAPSVDIYGSNAYRNGNFGSIWTEVKARYDKPVFYTEYGDLQQEFIGDDFVQSRQRSIHEASWENILANAPGAGGIGSAIGGIAFEWVDNWWQFEPGSPFVHDVGQNNEWHGLTSQGDGNLSPFLREKREVYDMYQDIWGDGTLPGVMKFSSSQFQFNEGDGTAVVTVLRSGGSLGEQVLNVTVTGADNTATNGVDYSIVPGDEVVTFLDGDVMPKQVRIQITQDSEEEIDEQFQLSLSIQSGNGQLVSPTQTTITIVDDDDSGPGPAFVEVVNNAGEWSLTVDGDPFIVKGMIYTPTKIGEDPNLSTRRDWMIVDDNVNGLIDAPYESFVDDNENGIQDAGEETIGDFKLMQEMGVNTIRVYHHASDSATVQDGYGSSPGQHLEFNHPPNKALLRDLYETYGIRVAMGDMLGAFTIGSGADFLAGTDYTNPIHKARMLESVRQMVLDFKDEPFLLMYILGSSNNASFTRTNANIEPVAFAQFVEEATQLIKSMDPNHPVAVCINNIGFGALPGQPWFLDHLDDHAPSVDIFGSDAFVGGAFDPILTEVQNRYDRPVLITEYGDNEGNFNGPTFDQQNQSMIHELSWNNMANSFAGGNGFGNSIGGFAVEFVDTWWNAGSPLSHNRGPGPNNFEYRGITTQGNGNNSPFVRVLREVYSTYQNLWFEPSVDAGVDQVVEKLFKGDGFVDGSDFLVWQVAFGSVLGDSDYNPLIDVEPDGDVDGVDFLDLQVALFNYYWEEKYNFRTDAQPGGYAPVQLEGSVNTLSSEQPSWTIESGPGGEEPIFEDLHSPTSRVIMYEPGVYVLRLSDNDGLSDTVTITILPNPNAAPIVAAAPGGGAGIDVDVPMFFQGFIGDGVVDEKDYRLWKNNFGRNLGDPDFNFLADMNRNNIVDAADFTVWRNRVGSDPADPIADINTSAPINFVFQGSVADDNVTGHLVTKWIIEKGFAPAVDFVDQKDPQTMVIFNEPDFYTFKLISTDGQFVVSDTLGVNVINALPPPPEGTSIGQRPPAPIVDENDNAKTSTSLFVSIPKSRVDVSAGDQVEIILNLPMPYEVDISIQHARTRQVIKTFRNFFDAGENIMRWDGSGATSGLYNIIIQFGVHRIIEKIVLVR